jgi:hypothetical protein
MKIFCIYLSKDYNEWIYLVKEYSLEKAVEKLLTTMDQPETYDIDFIEEALDFSTNDIQQIQ